MGPAINNLGRQLHMISNKLTPYDMFMISILNRTINLNRGFEQLITDNNFIAAAPLVRLNIDSMLKLYAPRIANISMQDCVKEIMKGRKLSDMKSKDRNPQNKLIKMTDRHLLKKLSAMNGFEWVSEIYDVGSSYVHFGDQLYYSSQQLEDTEQQIYRITIGEHDDFIDEKQKIGAVHWMTKSSDGVIELCRVWMVEKSILVGFDITTLDEVEY